MTPSGAMMTRTVVIVGFLVAFAAGLTMGTRSMDPPALSERHERKCGSWLEAELNLTPDQRQQMRQIWSETLRGGGRQRDERRRQLYRQRNEAIAELIRPEDRPKYDQIVNSYDEKFAELDREWRSAFQASVERTRQMLAPEQRVKYDQLMQRHQFDRGRSGSRPSGRGWHGERREHTFEREQRTTSKPA